MTQSEKQKHYFNLVAAGTLVFVVLVILGVCSAAQAQSPAGRNPLSYSQREYARRVLSDITSKYSVMRSHPMHEGVSRIVKRLGQNSPAPEETWRVFILNAPTIRDISATRGNYVFIWSGLFDLVNSEQELVAIISHVMGHVITGHSDPDPSIESQRMLIKTGKTVGHLASGHHTAGHVLTDGAANIASAINHKRKRMSKGYYYYPEDWESAADLISVQLVSRAGLDPKEILFFWMRAKNDRRFEQSLKFFRRHRLYPGRVENLGRMIPEPDAASNKAYVR